MPIEEEQMHTSVNLDRARFPAPPWLLAAFLLVFAAGIASGFVVRALSAPTAASTQQAAVERVSELCPSGSHVVVWYSAKAWGCLSDS
jgi:hypothetical protein